MENLNLQARMKMYEELKKAGKTKIQLSEKFSTTINWDDIEYTLNADLIDIATVTIEGGGIGAAGEALASIDIEYEGGNIHFYLRADHSGSHMKAGKKSLGYKIVNDVEGLEAFIRALISGKTLNEALQEGLVERKLNQPEYEEIHELMTDAQSYIDENRFAPAIDRLTQVIGLLKTYDVITEDVEDDIKVEVDGEVVTDTTEPVADGTTDVGNEVSEPSVELGIVEMLMQAVKDEYNTISFYNGLTANANECGRADIAAVISHINEEENIHVGQLQYCIEKLSQQATMVEDGKVEAEKIIAKAEEEKDLEVTDTAIEA